MNLAAAHGSGTEIANDLELLRNGLTGSGIVDLDGRAISPNAIRAAVIERSPVVGSPPTPPSGIDPHGLRVRNALVAGIIDLENASIPFAISFTSCRIPGLRIAGAKLDQGLDLTGSTIGTVDMSGAEIAGAMDLTGVRLTGRDSKGNSLDGTGVRVSGDLVLGDRFVAAGGIRLLGGYVGGQLILRGTRLNSKNENGCSLDGDDLAVERSAFLDRGFTAAGCIRLLGSHVKGTLEMTEARIDGTDKSGLSVQANRLRVDSDLFLDGGFVAAGVVSMRGMRAGGRVIVDMSGIPALLPESPDGEALCGLILDGSSIDHLKIELSGDKLKSGRRAQPEPTKESARRRRRISLENCVYRARPSSEQEDSATALLDAWLRLVRFHTPRYQPQAYQQLAAVHRVAGYDREAGMIMMAQQDHRRAALRRKEASAWHRASLWLSRLGLLIWKITLGYGYRSRRALVWLLIVLAISTCLVAVAASIPANAPTVPGSASDPVGTSLPVAYRPGDPQTGQQPGHCTVGEAAGLVVRITIPLISNVGQGSCIIDTASGLGSIIVLASIALQAFAWILGGLTVAALATAIKRSS